MFVGHYGAGFVARGLFPHVPLWVFVLAVQFLDLVWGPLVLMGVERVRIVPGVTASNPLDLFYMPYSHSLVAAVLWSLAAGVAWLVGRRGHAAAGAAMAVGVAVGSHWVLDLVVHRPDLPLFGHAAKVGLGLWDRPALALALEVGLLVGGAAFYLRANGERRNATLVLAGLMVAAHVGGFFVLPPETPAAAAALPLAAYLCFAAAAWWIEARPAPTAGAAA